MKLCILLVLFSFCYCSKDGIMPGIYQSKLADEKYLNSKSSIDLGDGAEYAKNQEYMSMSKSNDDITKNYDYNEKYIGSQKNFNKNGDKNLSGAQRRYTEEEMKERLDKIFGYTGPTANDEPENLRRPCALDDWQCIRKYFAANGNCKPAAGPIPDPLYIDVNTAFFTNANLTTTLTKVVTTGLSSARISEFYVNKKSGNLVLAVEIPILNMTSPRTYFRYRRTAKESIILAGLTTLSFQNLTTTVVIPKAPRLRLDLADIHIDIKEAVPRFFIGPEAALSADPDVLSSFATVVANLPISLREGSFFLVELYLAVYIQTNICDFGLKIISA